MLESCKPINSLTFSIILCLNLEVYLSIKSFRPFLCFIVVSLWAGKGQQDVCDFGYYHALKQFDFARSSKVSW